MLKSEVTNQLIYSTADIKKIYGLSTNGLFYYEDKGVITPERIPDNQYRIFKMEDCTRLYRARHLNSLGIEIKKCAQIVNYVNGETLKRELSLKKQEIQREIQLKTLKIHVINDILKLIDIVQQNDIPFNLTENPPMLRVAIKRKDTAKGSVCINIQDYRDWSDMIPLVNASILVHKDSLEPNNKFLCSLGFITTADIANYCQIKENNFTSIIPQQKCIYTIVSGSDSELYDESRFSHIIERIKQQGYVMVDDPFTKMIGTFDAGNGMLRHDEVWFPIA